MIATAALIMGECYESAHRDDYEANEGTLIMLVILMVFDYHMVLAL